MARSFTAASSQYLDGTTPVAGPPLTISVWAYPVSVPGAFYVIAGIGKSGSATTRATCTIIPQGGNAQFAVGDGSTNVSSPSGYSINAWYHIAATIDGVGNAALYVNGTSVQTGTLSVSSNTRALVGARFSAPATPGAFMDGYVADYGLYSTALTADEIGALSNGVPCTRIRPTSLAGFWPLCGGSPEQSIVSNGYGLTLNGSPTVVQHPRVGPPFGGELDWVPYNAAAATTNHFFWPGYAEEVLDVLVY